MQLVASVSQLGRHSRTPFSSSALLMAGTIWACSGTSEPIGGHCSTSVPILYPRRITCLNRSGNWLVTRPRLQDGSLEKVLLVLFSICTLVLAFFVKVIYDVLYSVFWIFLNASASPCRFLRKFIYHAQCILPGCFFITEIKFHRRSTILKLVLNIASVTEINSLLTTLINCPVGLW